VAHELRNPLGAVRASIFLLERKIKSGGSNIEQQIGRINKGVARCDDIITQLLDFSRTKALECDYKDLDGWLARLVEEEAEKLPVAVSIECDLGLDGRAMRFDPSRLSRVIINLLANASEALVGRGDDSTKFASANPLITIATRAVSRGIEISVSDNGPGIPDDVKSQILEPLFTTKSFGTGLGLPAVEKILQQHGARLEIVSRPGEGARFTAIFPHASAAA
jgi:signal transduction histidine kinase